MCKLCNDDVLSEKQKEAIELLDATVRNYGMLIRHLQKNLYACVTTRVPVQNHYTHATIPVRTKIVLRTSPSGRTEWHSGGVFTGSVFGSSLSQVFLGDWLDMESIEYTDLDGKAVQP